MEKISVLIVDDHKLFRSGLAELLKDQDEIRIAGEASNGEEALRIIEQFPPDIVLMDIDFGVGREQEGIVTTQRILELFPDQVQVIMLTMHGDSDYIFHAFEAGARGYILKDSDQEVLMKTIRSVHDGGVILTPMQAEKVRV